MGQVLLILEVSRSHTKRCTTVSRTPVDEWSARRRDVYLTTHNTHNRHIHIPGGIRTHNLSRRAAADLRLRPRSHWPTKLVLFVNVLTDLIKIIKPGLGITSIALLQLTGGKGRAAHGHLHKTKILFLRADTQTIKSVALPVKSGRRIGIRLRMLSRQLRFRE